MAQQYFTSHTGVDPKLVASRAGDARRRLQAAGRLRVQGARATSGSARTPATRRSPPTACWSSPTWRQVREVDPAMLARTPRLAAASSATARAASSASGTRCTPGSRTPTPRTATSPGRCSRAAQQGARRRRWPRSRRAAARRARTATCVALAANVAVAGRRARPTARTLMDKLAAQAGQGRRGRRRARTSIVGSGGEALADRDHRAGGAGLAARPGLRRQRRALDEVPGRVLQGRPLRLDAEHGARPAGDRRLRQGARAPQGARQRCRCSSTASRWARRCPSTPTPRGRIKLPGRRRAASARASTRSS